MHRTRNAALGVLSLWGLALVSSLVVGDQPALARTRKPKTFACSSAHTCVTAANSNVGTGTSATSTNGNGIQGNTNSNQAAVFGEATATSGGRGITARATGGFAEYAAFGDGGANGGVPLLASSESSDATLLKTENQVDGSIPMYVTTGGDLQILNLFYSAGSCRSGCERTHQRVVSYESRDTAATTEDVGEAELRDGTATVPLDAALERAIDPSAGYAVFVMPEGDTNGLYVARKTSAAFTVRETRNGRDSLRFAYRIVGRARGKVAQSQRLPFVNAAAAKKGTR